MKCVRRAILAARFIGVILGLAFSLAGHAAESQTIEFTPPTTVTWSTAPLLLDARASSGLPVFLSVVSGPGVISGSELRFTAAGQVRVRAEQGGNERYLPAAVERVITVTKSFQVITWPGLKESILAQNGRYALEATASSGLPVSFRVESGPARVEGETLVITGLGGIRLVAEQLGDEKYGRARLVRSYNAPESAVLEEVGAWPPYVSGEAYDMVTDGEHVYLAAGAAGLRVINISDATKPQFVADLDTAGSARGVELVGTYVYVADLNGGVVVVDISNPKTPRKVGEYAITKAYSLKAAGNYLYLAAAGSGFVVLDITDRANPKQVGINLEGSPTVVTVQGNFAYTDDVDTRGMMVFDVTNPARPVRRGVVGLGNAPGALEARGDNVFAATEHFSVQVVNVSDPDAPQVAGRYETTGRAYKLQLRENLLYVTFDNTLTVLDVSNPLAPQYVSEIEVGTQVGAVADLVELAGDIAVVTTGLHSGAATVKLIDVSAPLAMRNVGEFDHSFYFGRISVENGYAYINDYYKGMFVVDVSDPRAPVLVRKDVPIVYNSERTNDTDDGAVVSANGTRININHFILGGSFLEGFTDARALILEGTTVYVADGMGGLKVADITNPKEPRILGGLLLGVTQDLDVKGEYIYTIGWNNKMKVSRIAQVVHPQTIYFAPPAVVAISSSPIILQAEASSGLPVTFSFRGGPGVLEGNRLTLTGTGVITIRARHYGNEQFAPVTVDKTITVVPAPPKVGVRDGTAGRLEFYWVGETGYRLQRTESLTAPNWQDVAVVLEGGEYKAQVEAAGAEGYFRLVR